jgi:hypothetical protein
MAKRATAGAAEGFEQVRWRWNGAWLFIGINKRLTDGFRSEADFNRKARPGAEYMHFGFA